MAAQSDRDIGTEEETAEHLTGGPGVVATKSQAQGALGGGIVGIVAGALIGLGVGFFLGEAAIWIAPIVFAVGGFVAAAVFGGYFKSQKTREEKTVDV